MWKKNLIYYIALILFVLIGLFLNRAYRDLISYTELTDNTHKVYSGFQNIRILVNNVVNIQPHLKNYENDLSGQPVFFTDSQAIIHELNLLKAIVKDSVNIKIAVALDTLVKSQLPWMIQSKVPEYVELNKAPHRMLVLQKIDSLIGRGLRRTDFILEYQKNKLGGATTNLSRWMIFFATICVFILLYSIGRLWRQRYKTKLKEKELEISNRIFKNAQRIAQTGNWEYNIITGELHWSDEVFNIWGIAVTGCAVKYEQFFETIHADDRPLFSKHQAAAIAEQNEMDIEYRIILQNGMMKWVHERAKLVKDKQGKPIALEGTVQDITEQKHASLELLLNESKYRSLFENSLDGILLTTTDGKVLAANPAACAIFKMTENEICSVDREVLVDSKDHSLPLSLEARRLEGKVTGELRLVRKGGEIFPAEVRSSVFRDASDEERTCLIIRDIQERKSAEEKIEKNEKRFRALIENNDGIISLVDEKLTVLFRSSSAARITGWTNDEFAKIDTRELIHPDDLAGLMAITTTAVANPAKVLPVLFRARHKDEHYIWLEASVTNMMHDQDIGGIITNMRDISKRIAAEQKTIKVSRLYYFISHINQVIVRTTDEETLFKDACDIAVDLGKFRMAWIGMIDEATRTLVPVMCAGDERGYLDIIKISLDETMPEGGGPTATTIRSGKFNVCNEIAGSSPMAPWREAAAERGYCSSIALPIKKFGKVVGAFNLYAAEINFFDPEEIALLEEATADICFALENFEKERLRKETELALKKVNERLLIAQEIAHNGYWEIDLVNDRHYWSDELYKIFDIEIGKPVKNLDAYMSLLHPDDRQIFSNGCKSMIEMDVPLNVEYRFICKDGSIKYLLAIGKLIKDDDGKPVLLEGTTQDITELKLTEEKIRLNEKRLLKAQEIGKLGYWQQDLNSDVVWASKQAMSIYGFPAVEGEVSKAEIAACIVDLPKVQLALTALLKHHKEYNTEFRIKPADGSPMKIIAALAEVEKDQMGNPIRIIGTLQDITERKKAEEALNNNRVFIESIINASPDIIYIYDIDERENVFVNQGIEINLGYSTVEIKQMGNQVIQTLMHPADFEYYLYHTYPRYAFAKDKEIVTHEFRMKDKTANWHWFYCKESVFLRSADGKPKQVFGITTDITDRKKAEADIIKEKNLSDSIINSMPGIFYLYNKEGKFLRWNRNMELVSRYSPDEISEMHPLEFIENDERKLVASAISNVFALGSENIQATIVSKLKEKIPYYFTGIAINYEGSTCVMGVGIDISESVAAQEKIKQSTEQLRQLALHLQTIREDERKRIGREIHDELGQQLTAINMDVAWINKKIPEESTLVKTKLKNVIHLLNGSHQSIRRILNELRPVILDENGLRDAIEWLVQQFTGNTGIPVKCSLPDINITTSDTVANCVFRAYQEAFTNITRYAQAVNVTTSLCIAGNTLIVVIEDDGIGFDLASVIAGKSFGIFGMKERVISLGGVFELDSSPGKGAKIVLRLPVNN